MGIQMSLLYFKRRPEALGVKTKGHCAQALQWLHHLDHSRGYEDHPKSEKNNVGGIEQVEVARGHRLSWKPQRVICIIKSY